MPKRNDDAATRKLRAAKLRSQALQMKLAGATQTQIAERLGVSVPTVSKYVRKELDALALANQKDAALYRAQELARIDALQRRAWPRAVGSDDPGNYREPSAQWFDRALSCIELRSKLLGLFLPANMPQGEDGASVDSSEYKITFCYEDATTSDTTE